MGLDHLVLNRKIQNLAQTKGLFLKDPSLNLTHSVVQFLPIIPASSLLLLSVLKGLEVAYLSLATVEGLFPSLPLHQRRKDYYQPLPLQLLDLDQDPHIRVFRIELETDRVKYRKHRPFYRYQNQCYYHRQQLHQRQHLDHPCHQQYRQNPQCHYHNLPSPHQRQKKQEYPLAPVRQSRRCP